MSTAQDVADHIYGSLLDLRRRVDTAVAVAVARAMIDGANRALEELSAIEDDRVGTTSESAPINGVISSAKH